MISGCEKLLGCNHTLLSVSFYKINNYSLPLGVLFSSDNGDNISLVSNQLDDLHQSYDEPYVIL